MVETGVQCQHISNNAPTNLASADDALRKAGVDVGKKWLDGAKILGATDRETDPPLRSPAAAADRGNAGAAR